VKIFGRPWWVWLIVLALVALLVDSVFGVGYQKKLFGLVLDQLRTDQTKVIQTLEKNMKGYESQILSYENEITAIRKEKSKIQAQYDSVAAERSILKEKIHELETKRQIIIISSDPDVIIGDLRRLGIQSIRRR
jgi:peptidoglycan hydrolase CwlO-like protein